MIFRHHARLAVLGIFALAALPAHARWANKEDSPLVLENSHDRIYVHADGSQDWESEFEISVVKEAGIDHMKLFRTAYDPNQEQLTVLEASITNGTSTLVVAPGMIEDKAVASEGQGLSSQHQLTIPFPAVAVASRMKVKMKRHVNAPYVPGVLNIKLNIAQSMFSNADVSEIKSELPLVVRHKGASDLVSFEEGKEGNLFTLKVSLQRPALRMITQEAAAFLTADTLPRIEVGAAGKTWAEMAKFFAAKLEAPLQEPLPPEFAEIVTAAAKETSGAAKAHLVMAKLIEKVKYMGDWRNERGYYLPRSLADITTTKQGDCKDLAFSTVVMLRKLGIPATMAIVHRGPEDPMVGMLTFSSLTFDPLLPGMNYFNHAILTAEIEGRKLWLDPTNPVAQVGDPFSDIADRSALVLDAQSTGLARVPKAGGSNLLSVERYFAFRSGGKADVMAGVSSTGPQALDIKRVKAMVPEEQRKFLLLSAAERGAHPQFLGDVETIESGMGMRAAPGTETGLFSYTVEGKGTKTSLGNSFQVSAPPGMRLFMMAGGGRVTGLRLGDPTVETRRTVLANFQLQGDVPESCEVANQWVRASRKFTKQPGGLEWTDRLETLVSNIPLADANSNPYVEFQKRLEKCFGDSLLVYKWELPDVRKPGFAPLPNFLIRDKTALQKRAERISEDTSQEYENYTYVRLLLNEVLQTSKNNEEIAKAIGSMSFNTRNQAFHSSVESDPDDVAEAVGLNKIALERDPNEVYGNLLAAGDALNHGAVETALAIYDKILEKHPKSPGANTGKWRLLVRRARSAALRENEYKNVIGKAEAMIVDPAVDCKKCITNFLMAAYSETQNVAKVEEQFMRLIQFSPHSAWALLNYANFLNDHNRYAEAEDYARKAIKMAPVGMAHLQLAEAISNKALAELLQNPASKEGIGHCEEALEHDRTNRNCLSALATIYGKLGNRDQDAHLQKLSGELQESVVKISAASGKQVMSGMQTAQLARLQRLVDTDPSGAFVKATAVTALGSAPPPVATVGPAPKPAPPEISRAPASVPSSIEAPLVK